MSGPLEAQCTHRRVAVRWFVEGAFTWEGWFISASLPWLFGCRSTGMKSTVCAA